MGSRATLQDIADRLKLSRSSVALALRMPQETCPLAPETWTIIRQAAQDLDYRPNRSAQSLARGKARCLGILTQGGPGLGLFYGRLVEHLSQEVNRFGQDLLLIDASGPESAWIGKLQDGRIDGGFLLPPAPLAVVGFRARIRLPLLSLNLRTEDPDLGGVVADDAGAIAQAYAHLHGLGHRRIAYFCDSRNNHAPHSIRLRQEAFSEECRRRGNPPFPTLTDPGDILTFLRETADRPTAIICYNDLNALRLITAGMQAGWRIPEDVSVVGINDDPYAATMTPALTTVSLEPLAIAQSASAALLGEIEGQGTIPGIQVIPSRLIVRASTGPVGI